MRVLQIQHDRGLAKSVESVLRGAGCQVTSTPSDVEGLELAVLHRFDVILLELALEATAGPELLHMLRLVQVRTPVVMVSGGPEAELRRLSREAQGWITLPADPQALVMRVSAAAGRGEPPREPMPAEGEAVPCAGNAAAGPARGRVRLAYSAYDPVELAVLHRGGPVTREMVVAASMTGWAWAL